MLAVVKRCGKAAEIAHISGELGELQDIVGGLIEGQGLDEDTDIICNDEGKILGMPMNVVLGDGAGEDELDFIDVLCGDIVIVGCDRSRGAFVSLEPASAVSLVRRLSSEFVMTSSMELLPVLRLEQKG